ncbi:MAG: DUF4920 domain-containing protein [Bacteroidota bacterium]
MNTMLKQFSLLLAIGMIFFACGPAPQEQSKEAAQAPEHFGDNISLNDAISYEALLERMQSSDSLNIKVSGKVSSVCQKKGCWMNIVSDQENQPEMFVKFKDYGFFMPLNIAGRTVVMEGYAFKNLTSVEELRHYAEDEGKSKEEIEAITEPEEQLSFLASGVVLLPEKS